MKHYIIPLFIPHAGCPHQCVFCDQKKITGEAEKVTAVDIKNKLDLHLGQITKPYFVEAAFYGGTFTALPVTEQEELLAPAAAAYREGKIQAIRLSTRPDAIDTETLDRLKKNGVKTIELGAQSFSDEVLKKSGRGHTADDIFRAAELIKASGIELGIQLMPGLPGDTRETLNTSLEAVLAIRPAVVRIYPTVVIKGTPLADIYERGEYQPLTIEEAARIAAVMKLRFEGENIRVIRTGLQSSEELDDEKTVLAGPYHPAFGELVENEIYWAMLEQVIAGAEPKRLIIYHEAGETSKLRGIKNCNADRLQKKLPDTAIRIYAAPIGKGRVMADIDGKVIVIERHALQMKI